MKRKNGFTLIELLAVIVILAIIALIATPIILNTIEKARKNSAMDSTYGYVKAIESQNALYQLDSEKYQEITSGDIASINSKVNLKGKKPTSGTVTIEKGTVTQATLCINGYTVTYDGTKVTSTTKGCNEQNNNQGSTPSGGGSQSTFGGTYVPATSGQTHKGIVYLDPSNLSATCTSTSTLTTTPTGCKKFYIFDDSNNNYKMIMDRNTTATIAWITQTDYKDDTNWNNNIRNNKGSITLNTQLAIDTAGWTGNPELISADEIAAITSYDGWDSSTISEWFCLDTNEVDWTNYCSKDQGTSAYKWLFDYTYDCIYGGCDTADSSTNGYWTKTPTANKSYAVWAVSSNGTMADRDVNIANDAGIRPVITISQSIINS